MTTFKFRFIAKNNYIPIKVSEAIKSSTEEKHNVDLARISSNRNKRKTNGKKLGGTIYNKCKLEMCGCGI